MPPKRQQLPVVLVCTALLWGAAGAASDDWLAQPVDDATFATFLAFYEYDRALPLEVEVSASATEDGVRRERLTYQSTAGMRVTAEFRVLDEATPQARPAAILLHGGGALGKDAPSMTSYADLLARAGFAVLSIDMLHYGERSDGLLEVFSNPDKVARLYGSGAPYLDFVIQTVKDVRRGVDFLVQERAADPEKLMLAGMSRGAVMATISGAVEKRFAAVALLYGGHALTGLPETHLAPACPANYVGRLAPRPTLFINGNQDTVFEKNDAVLPLMALAGASSESVWLDTGHGGGGQEQATAFLTWIRRHLMTR